MADDQLGGLAAQDTYAPNGSYGPFMPQGMVEPGNIDLHNRPVVHNPDGSISTVRSITVGEGNGSVLLPTVVGGRVVSNDAAIQHYRDTGEHLGRFNDDASADAYGQQLHEDQAQEYLPQANNQPLGSLVAPNRGPLLPPPYQPPGQAYAKDALGDLARGAGGAINYFGGILPRFLDASQNSYTTGQYDPAPFAEGVQAVLPLSLGAAPRGAIGAFGGKLVQPEGIRAYHSSPYDFDRFDVSKIGTGEGAQVYGHGLYFAENPAVSGQGGEYWRKFQKRFSGPESTASNYFQSSQFNRDAAIQRLNDEIAQIEGNIKEGQFSNGQKISTQDIANLSAYREQQRQALNLLTSGKPVGPRTYEVNIAARPEQFLDWDQPLNKQAHLIEPMNQAGYNIPRGAGDLSYLTQKAAENGPDSWYAQQLRAVRDMVTRPGSEFAPKTADVSSALNKAGIPGIKYLDQGSRGVQPEYNLTDPGQLAAFAKHHYPDNPVQALDIWGPEGEAARQLLKSGQPLPKLNDLAQRSSNYVVWNPDLITIMRKYGIAGALPAAGLGELARQDNYQ